MTEPRSKSILLKVTDAERSEIAARARVAGLSANAFIRARVFDDPGEVASSPVDKSEVPLAERREARVRQLAAQGHTLLSARRGAAEEITE